MSSDSLGGPHLTCNGCMGPPYMPSPGASRTMQPSAGSPDRAQVLFGSIRFGRFPVDVPPQKSNIDLDTNTDGPPFFFWSTALWFSQVREPLRQERR